MREIFNEIQKRLPWVLLMTLIGGLGFTWVQALSGTGNIAEFVGKRTVEIGGYPDNFAGPIGWSTHMYIAFAYSMAAATIVSLPFFPNQTPKKIVFCVVLGVVVGWITTLIANPAIVVTCNLLALKSPFASDIFELGVYTKFGVPLWNHLWFFTAAFLLTGVAADRRGDSHEKAASPSLTSEVMPVKLETAKL